MIANANASFFGNLRGKDASVGNTKSNKNGKATIPVFEDKVNKSCLLLFCMMMHSFPTFSFGCRAPTMCVDIPWTQENSSNASSRLRRPKTAAAILQNKSTEINTGRLDASVASIYKGIISCVNHINVCVCVCVCV